MSDPSLIKNAQAGQKNEELLATRPWLRHYEEGIPANLDIPDRPLTWLLDNTVRRYPNATALIYYGNKITYAQFSTLANRFAIGLQKLGVKKGDRVALALPNIPQYPIAFYGALRAGAVVVPTNPIYTERELQHQLKDSGATIIVMLDSLYPLVRDIRPLTVLEHVIVTSPANFLPPILRVLYPLSQRGVKGPEHPLTESELKGDATLHTMRSLLTNHKGSVEAFNLPVQVAGDDLAALQYTGGTTGMAKGAMLTHRNLLANAMQTRYWTPKAVEGKEISLCVAPFFHSYGLTVGMNLSILAAAAMVLMPRFKPKDVIDAIRRYRPTLFPGIPTMYIALLREAGEHNTQLRSIKYCISGAAPLPAKVESDFERMTGATLVEGYGLSEASPVTHCNPLTDERRNGSIGLPLPNVEAAILNRQTGEPAPLGEVGEIVVKGPNIMKGYWQREDESNAVFINGWMHTGDVGKMDADGYFYVVERAKDMIIAGGFNIYPREVEEVLFHHPAVAEAAVIGMPDEYRGETVAAFVVLKPGIEPSEKTRQEIIAFCKQELAAYKVPKKLEFRESLPKSLIGKVLRRELRVTQEFVRACPIRAVFKGETTIMSTTTRPTEQGTAFLTTPVSESADKIFTLEKRDEEQTWIEESAATFITREVLPHVDAIDRQEPGLMPSLVKKAGEQGLLMIDIPEAYGGAELGLLTSALVGSELREASFSVAFGAHTTIGTLPIVYYGTEEQKQKYLPKLATGEWITAYALTEPGAGSDAMNLSTRAELAPNGKHYILNGTKQWISNAGFADMMIVFARVGDNRPSAFIVEASYPGVSTGAEENKMGIKGSSTRQVYFEDAPVPVENLLGELHKGYKIAFNILNIGRLKLGAGTVGGARNALKLAATYTTERKSFGKFLHEFGMIKKKLARVAAETYAAESEVFRTAGNIAQAQLSAGEDTENVFKSIEEYAIEASLAKVHGSEVLALAVDEGVQIFGGYGFMHEYPIEKAYRDARIQRIFEGTNEINRLVASGTLFRRVLGGKLDLMTRFPEIEARVKAGQAPERADETVPAELRGAVNALERAKDATIYSAMKAAMKYMQGLENEQEFIECLANLLIDLYATDSALARAIQAVKRGDENSATHVKLAQLATWLAFSRIRSNLDQLIMTNTDEERIEKELARIRTYVGDYVFNGVPVQRELAALVVEKQGYPL